MLHITKCIMQITNSRVYEVMLLTCNVINFHNDIHPKAMIYT